MVLCGRVIVVDSHEEQYSGTSLQYTTSQFITSISGASLICDLKPMGFGRLGLGVMHVGYRGLMGFGVQFKSVDQKRYGFRVISCYQGHRLSGSRLYLRSAAVTGGHEPNIG